MKRRNYWTACNAPDGGTVTLDTADGERWALDGQLDGAGTVTVRSPFGAELATVTLVAAGGINLSGWVTSQYVEVSVTGANLTAFGGTLETRP